MTDDALDRQLRSHFDEITQHFDSSAELGRAFVRSRDAILGEARRYESGAGVRCVGPDTSKSAGFWGCWLTVETDSIKRAMLTDIAFLERLKSAGVAGGFAPVEIEIESEETVRRDYQGSWFFRLR